VVAIQEAVKSLESLLKDMCPEEVELVASTLKKLQAGETSLPEEAVIKTLVGRTYTPQEKLKLELESLFRYFERRRQLLKGALTAPEVAQLLGTSRQTPHDRIKSQTMLGVLDRGAYRYPVWQFDPEGPDGVIEGLPEVLKVLEISEFAKLNWLMRSNPFLEGLTPVQALKKGQKERVIQEAMAVKAS
jgi:hypothetical protein